MKTRSALPVTTVLQELTYPSGALRPSTSQVLAPLTSATVLLARPATTALTTIVFPECAPEATSALRRPRSPSPAGKALTTHTRSSQAHRIAFLAQLAPPATAEVLMTTCATCAPLATTAQELALSRILPLAPLVPTETTLVLLMLRSAGNALRDTSALRDPPISNLAMPVTSAPLALPFSKLASPVPTAPL